MRMLHTKHPDDIAGSELGIYMLGIPWPSRRGEDMVAFCMGDKVERKKSDAKTPGQMHQILLQLNVTVPCTGS